MNIPLPGAEPFSLGLASVLTPHLGAHHFVNRLALETSPYLRDHAHNPVNWYPWGDEAFAAAKALARPILLSVGYSTCHWCHVMEEESFEDEAVAAFMNTHYVCIKVDREERPDIDAVYMSALLLLTQHGGWPMTVWLDAERRPFFAGTYFPPHDHPHQPSFSSVLAHLYDIWQRQPEKVAAAAHDITRAVASELQASEEPREIVAQESVLAAVETLRHRYDSQNGGLWGAPKFPSQLPISLLFRLNEREMAVQTLAAMARRGLFDQLGGGFHRYSTDAAWQVPHFEKMLYDNALLVSAYVEAWQILRQDRELAEEFRWVAEDTLAWGLSAMLLPSGAFAAATDADSLDATGHRHEGIYFTWTPAELKAALGDSAEEAAAFLGVSEGGHIEGRSVLSRRTGQIPTRWRAALLAERAKRPPPARDDKVITAWNGYLCSALARASFAFNVPRYAQAAARALSVCSQGGTLVRIVGGNTPGFLDDYAAIIAARLDLFAATSEREELNRALQMQALVDAEFSAPDGGYFSTSSKHERLIARQKPMHDGAEPSGNSLCAMNLARLYALTLRSDLKERFDALVFSSKEAFQRYPTQFALMLQAIDFAGHSIKEVTIVRTESDSADNLLEVMRQRYLPNCVMVAGTNAGLDALSTLVPWATNRASLATAFVCEKQVCQAPCTTATELSAALELA